MPKNEQRVYDAADDAYLSEGGYLAPVRNGSAQVASDNVAAGSRRGSEPLPRTDPAPDEIALMSHSGIAFFGRVCRYAQRSHDYLHDALMRARAVARRRN